MGTPLDQSVAGPRRNRFSRMLEGTEGGDARPFSQMIEGARTPTGETIRDKAGKKVGWRHLHKGCFVAYQTAAHGSEAKNVSSGRVMVNDPPKFEVWVQPYKAVWHRTELVHRPLFESSEGLTTESTPREARESVEYEALVLQVGMLSGGEPGHGAAGTLGDRGWRLLINKNESLQTLRDIQSEVKCLMDL